MTRRRSSHRLRSRPGRGGSGSVYGCLHRETGTACTAAPWPLAAGRPVHLPGPFLALEVLPAVDYCSSRYKLFEEMYLLFPGQVSPWPRRLSLNTCSGGGNLNDDFLAGCGEERPPPHWRGAIPNRRGRGHCGCRASATGGVAGGTDILRTWRRHRASLRQA